MNQRAIEAGARGIARVANPFNVRGRNLDAYEAIHWLDYKDQAAAVITAYEAHMKADGFVVVPVIPTQAMIEAGCDNNPTSWNEGTDLGFAADVANDVYRAMLSAATTGENDA
jgi:hypothetical protein